MNYLFLGDSITDCDRSFDPENLGKGYVRMIAKELGKEHPVFNKGTDGFTVANVKRAWNMYYSDMNPDFITILVGINDVSIIKLNQLPLEEALNNFEETYDSLIQSIKAKTTCPILLMEPFIFPQPAAFLNWYPEVKKVSKIIQTLAQKYELEFLPLWEDLLSAGNQITIDGVHLTPEGHRIIAKKWLSR